MNDSKRESTPVIQERDEGPDQVVVAEVVAGGSDAGHVFKTHPIGFALIESEMWEERKKKFACTVFLDVRLFH